MLKITKQDEVSIEYIGNTDGFDGHCLRAYSYWKNLMPDITAQLDEIHKEGKVYKVTYNDGSVEYLNEHNPKLIKLRGNSNESN